MDSARPLSSNKLLTLHEAAQRLAISVDDLIELNENNILVPTVSKEGFVSYSQAQIETYLHPEKIEEPKAELVSQEPLTEKAGRAESEAKQITSGPADESLFQRLVRLAGNGFYEDNFVKEYEKPQAEGPLAGSSFNFNLISFTFKPTRRQIVPVLATLVVLLVLGIFTQQNRIKYFLDKSQTNSTPAFSAQTGQAVLGAETSKIKLTGSIIFSLPLTVKADTMINQNLEVGGTSIFKGDITAPNVVYGIKAGDHIVITNAASQTPTISADLSDTVSSFQGQTGDITLTAGTDISISGTTISNTSTLSTITSRSSCDSCITDADVTNGLTIDASGSIVGEAIKTGIISPSVGGTGLTTYAPGDILYGAANNSLATLTAGDTGHFLMMGMAGVPEWDYVGSFAVAVVKEDNAVISPITSVLNFASKDFSLNVNPTQQVNFELNPILGSVIGVVNSFNVGGNTLSFTGSGTVTSSGSGSLTLDSATTGDVNIGTGTSSKAINIGGSGGNNINIGTDNTTADTINIGSGLDTVSILGDVTANTLSASNVTISGGSINGTTIGGAVTSSAAFTSLSSSGNTTLATTAGVSTAIGNATGALQIISTGLNVTAAGGITIPESQSLTVGNISLNSIGSDSASSGANLIGVFDNLNNSSSNNLQQVLKDLDTSITTSGISPFTTGSDLTYGSFINPIITANNFILGGSTIASSKLFFNAATANLALGTDNTGAGGENGTLTLYSEGNGVTDTSLTTNANGDLVIPNGNVGVGAAPVNVDADNNPFKLEVGGSIGPNQNAVFDLGSPTMQYRNLYLTDQTTSGGDITIANSSPKIYFVDTTPTENQYLLNADHSQFTITNNTTGANALTVNANGNIDLAGGNSATGCTIADATGNLDCSGSGTFGSSLTATNANLTNTANQISLGQVAHNTVISSAAQTAATTLSIPIMTNASDTFVFADQGQTLENKTIGSTGLTFSSALADITTLNGGDLTIAPSTQGLINGEIILAKTVQFGSLPTTVNNATTMCRDNINNKIVQCPANAALSLIHI